MTPDDPRLELLRYQAEDGIWLNALLYRPEAETRALFILVPGLIGAVLGAAHDYQPLARELTGRGYALMLLNLRSAGDFVFSIFDDAKTDIAAAVAQAKVLGFDRIALFGTSLGGPRVAWYLANVCEPAVQALGFLASIKSPYLEAQLRMSPEMRQRLDAFLALCRTRVAEGRSHEVVTFADWFPGRAMALAARSFLSYFGNPEDSNATTVKFASAIVVPTLVIHGTADEIALPPNAEAIYASLTAAPKRDLVWVEGARHYLASGSIAEAYAQRIAEWVAANLPLG